MIDDSLKDYWNAVSLAKKEKKQSNLEYSTNLLREKNIPFIEKNNGVHLIIENFDFFPSTGLFINRKTKRKGRGVLNLIRIICVGEKNNGSN